jgi:hypothetical protein
MASMYVLYIVMTNKDNLKLHYVSYALYVTYSIVFAYLNLNECSYYTF